MTDKPTSIVEDILTIKGLADSIQRTLPRTLPSGTCDKCGGPVYFERGQPESMGGPAFEDGFWCDECEAFV